MTSPTRSVATGTRCATTTEPLPIAGAIESPTTTCRCRPKLIGTRASRVTGTQTMAPTSTRTHRGMGRRTGAVTISIRTPSPKAVSTWRTYVHVLITLGAGGPVWSHSGSTSPPPFGNSPWPLWVARLSPERRTGRRGRRRGRGPARSGTAPAPGGPRRRPRPRPR